MATGMAERLGEAAARGVPIVGVEPSCLLTLRDEYPALLPGDPRRGRWPPRRGCQRNCSSRRSRRAGSSCRRTMRVSGRRIVFHGHCHQKALAGTAATTALLRSIPGAEVIELDAGCCGMAGSFGFEAEHYDLSMTHRRAPALPRRPRRGGGHDHRGDRRFLPAADRARDRADRPSIRWKSSGRYYAPPRRFSRANPHADESGRAARCIGPCFWRSLASRMQG